MVASHLAMTDGSASLHGSWPEHGGPSAFAAGRTSPAGSCSNSNCGSVSESCVPDSLGTLAQTTNRNAMCKRGRCSEEVMNFLLAFTQKL